jgi:hypothetical protein
MRGILLFAGMSLCLSSLGGFTLTNVIEFAIPEQKQLKKLDGRQIAIMLENTLSTLKTEMTPKQRRDFANYFGDMRIQLFWGYEDHFSIGRELNEFQCSAKRQPRRQEMNLGWKDGKLTPKKLRRGLPITENGLDERVCGCWLNDLGMGFTCDKHSRVEGEHEK